jgi:dTMP kinase
MFLMLAQRTEHVKKVIYPALAAGTVVLCDRYLDSSLAYQGYGRGITPSRILRLHLSYLGSCLPDLTVLFDIPPEEGLVRARHGGRKHLDRMEAQDLTFHQKVRAGYLSLARRQAARFLTLDARQNPDEVFSRLTIALKKRFPELLA